ncbi:unnamed protein product [Trichobilharzia regenti]|nr:unnamed protein product [Trichobilharzia regenti]
MDDALEPYLSPFSSKNISGKWLSSLTADVLGKYGVQKIGHQMIIMEKVKQLQYQFSSFDNETLQSVLLRVSRSCVCIVSAINSLMAITKRQDADSPYPGILSDIQGAVSYVLNCILNLMSTIGNAASWLERLPYFTLFENSQIGWLHYRVADLMRHSSQHISLRLRKRPTHSNDFIGFPGAGRRHRLMVNQIPPAGSLSQTRGAYIFARNPKRRLPLTGPLSTEPLAVTQEITSDQASVSSPTSTSPPESQSIVSASGLFSSSPTSSLSVHRGASIKIMSGDSCNLDNSVQISSRQNSSNESVMYSNSRLIASTPNTPLMALRSVDSTGSHSSLSFSPHLPPAYPGVMNLENGLTDSNVISSDITYSK